MPITQHTRPTLKPCIYLYLFNNVCQLSLRYYYVSLLKVFLLLLLFHSYNPFYFNEGLSHVHNVHKLNFTQGDHQSRRRDVRWN